MSTPLLLDALIRSIQVGSLYALMAVGLTLTLAVFKLPNFAHAEFVTIGAYAALIASIWLPENLPIILGLAFVCSGLIALLGHKVVFRPLERLKPSIYTLILASFAFGLILRYIIFLFIDYFDLFDRRIQAPLEIWYQTDSVILTNIFFWVVPTTVGLILLLSLLLNFTNLGREMRALAANPVLARVIGIKIERVTTMTWLLVGGLAGVAGALWGIYTSINPLLGWLAILSVFAATVLGGMTSFTGTILGAYVVGLSENLLMQLLNIGLGLDFSFKPAIPFALIILVLLFRPQGLTGFFDHWQTRNIIRNTETGSVHEH